MIKLYDYFRSSAAYRIRIGLNLKGLGYESVPVSLIDGEQSAPDNLARNPQGLVPTLEIDGHTLTQSLAILDYLDRKQPDPAFLPEDAAQASHVLAMALAVACDIHPVNNLRILKYLRHELGQEQETIDDWYRHWIAEGFAGLETMAKTYGGEYLSGDTPGLADICLVPQMYNACRFETPLDAYPTLVAYDAKLTALPPFAAAHPDVVKP